MRTSTNLQKTIGILGGMGPYAGIVFMKNILDLTQAKKDSDHIRMIVDNHPHLPSRTRAVLYDEESPVMGMVDAINKLQDYPVDVVVIPCNSACNWVPEIRRKIKVPIIDIVEIACIEASEKFNIKKVAVLGGPVVYKKQLYRLPLQRAGFEYIDLPEVYHDKIYSFIEKIKTLGTGIGMETEFSDFVYSLQSEFKFEGLILACTEFSVFQNIPFKLPIVDSNSALAKFVVEYAKFDRPIPFNSDEVSLIPSEGL